MKPKRMEDDQLQQFLNRSLYEMPLMEPTSAFTDKVMHALESARTQSQVHTVAAKPVRWKREIVHGLLASAATYLFITSGMFHSIITIDDHVHQLSAYITKLTQFLQ
jgi:hypothetical protein